MHVVKIKREENLCHVLTRGPGGPTSPFEPCQEKMYTIQYVTDLVQMKWFVVCSNSPFCYIYVHKLIFLMARIK